MASERHLPFLIIGGHAVNAYGYSRFTNDLDVLIRGTDRAVWIAAPGELGFMLYQYGGGFLQMTPPAECRWPLALMLVAAATFEPMLAASREIEVSERKLRVPSLEHLFALKFHALKQEIPGRGYKDLLDVLALADCNAVDLQSDKIRRLCEKYGSPKIYERLIAFKG